jgi:short-subunit dehydrogenase
MKKVLIIGATSAIAICCAKKWASGGNALYLVARNQDRLKNIANDLKTRGAAQVDIYCTDLNEMGNHSEILDAASNTLKGLDIVLIAHGTLSNQQSCEQNVKETISEIQTNALSTISLLTIVSNRFEAKKNGIIAIISSVAGERGRASNYVYGSAKAMVTTFASGLRQRLNKFNVQVTTFKLGFVDTPMTAKFKKGWLWAKPDVVAVKIVEAIDKRKDEVYIPGFWWVVMALIKMIPNKVFNKIKF